MILAYAILVHRNPMQVARLVNALQGPKTIICIHVDRAVDQRPFEAALSPLSNVYFVPHRVRAFLYSYRLIEATLRCFQCVLTRKADHVVLLSGQDYPLRPVDDIHQFFDEHADRQFIDWRPVDDEFWRERVRHLYFNAVQPMILQRSLNKLAKFRDRRPPSFGIFGGSAWVSVSARFAEYLVETLGESTAFSKFLRYTHVPEELAIQTVAMNGPFQPTVVNDNLRHLRWSPAATHPDVFTKDDFDELTRSGKLFSRKFDLEKYPLLIDRIDREILRPDGK